jgi:hypothetical protein
LSIFVIREFELSFDIRLRRYSKLPATRASSLQSERGGEKSENFVRALLQIPLTYPLAI